MVDASLEYIGLHGPGDLTGTKARRRETRLDIRRDGALICSVDGELPRSKKRRDEMRHWLSEVLKRMV